MKKLLMTLCALPLAATAGILFEEDFSNYNVKAPGVTDAAGVTVYNEAINTQRGWLRATVKEDVEIFTSPKALPKGNAFDVLFKCELVETNSAFEVVFRTADGRTLAVPFAGKSERREVALKASAGKLTEWVTQTNLFVKARAFDLPGELKSVNFRVKAGGKTCFSEIVIRTPAALPDRSALAQYAALESVTQPLVKPLVSDGAPLGLLDRSYSFVPGATGVVGRLEITWDSGTVQKDPITVGDQRYWSPYPRAVMPQLGLKAGETWIGKDAVVFFGADRLHVRPSLRNFADWRRLAPKGEDVVRDWNLLPPASRHVTTVELRREGDACQLWLDGSYVRTLAPRRNDKASKRVVKAELVLGKGVAYRVNAVDREALQLWARPRAKAFAAATVKGEVAGCARPLDASDVGIAHCAKGGYSMTEDAYTMRPPTYGYPGEVHFRLPAAPYAQAEITFCLDDAPGKVPYLVTRLARYPETGGSGCTTIEDAVLDLTKGVPPSVRRVGTVVRGGKDYPLYRTTVDLPIGRCIDYATGDFVDLEFAGPMRENLQQCDNRQKPRDDVSSAFTLFGVRLRKLNVAPEMVQVSPGNVFTADEESKTTAVSLKALVDGAKGVISFGDERRPYALAKAGDVVTNVYDFSDREVGLYRMPVTVDDGAAKVCHEMTVCVTPEAGRLATAAESPYGTWWFTSHGSPKAAEIGGPLFQKAGIRKVTARPVTAEERAKYDILPNGAVYAPGMGEFDAEKGCFRSGEEAVVAKLKKDIEKAGYVNHIMVWHESAPNCAIPEEVLGLAAPTNDTAREKRTAAYVNEVGRICHKHFPGIPLQIGNTSASVGAVAVPLRGGAKAEYYDLVGMEIPSQTIVPERLIEVGFTGQNIAKAVGRKMSGRDFRTGGCLEFTYRSDRDLGVRGEALMAEWHMRDLIISLMNGYTLASPAELFDCTTGYCNEIWGVVGLVRRKPFAYPKMAYLAYAVLTKALDGVKFVREIPTGSTTVYAAEFLRKDGLYATAFWCARGEADLVCDVKGELWTMEGGRSSVGGWFSDAEFACSGAPVYLLSKKPCASVRIAARRFADDAKLAAQGTEVVGFSAADVTVSPDPEMESRHHDFLPYLKPGVFTAKDVEDPEEGACLELTLDTDAPTKAPVTEFVTEYTTVRLAKPVAVPGVAALLGVRVKGDSGWGQVRFEIEDAEGEVFKGLSTGPSWGCDVYDWPGYTALSFDGWGDVYQQTDRNDFGLAISPGDRGEQWCSATGGNKRIDWPVKLRAVTVCVNRFKPTLLGFEPVKPSVRLKRVWSVPAK